MQAGGARRLRVRGEPQFLHHLTDDEGDLPHVRPLPRSRRIEVDEQVVRLLDLRDARVPRVQLDAPQVDHPGQCRPVVDDGEDRRMAAREPDELRADEVRMGGHPLLVEEIALDAVRIPHHVEGPASQMRQGTVRDVEVVLDEVALREPRPRKEELVRVREGDLVPVDLHGSESC